MKELAFKRAEVAQTVIDNFLFQPLELGKRDCAIMAQTVAEAFGVTSPLTTNKPTYKTELGAAKFLKKLGYDTLADAVDTCGFERLSSPAYALAGDILAVENEAIGGFSLMVATGNGKAIGFVQIAGEIKADTCDILEATVLNRAAGRQIIGWKVVA